MKKISLAVIIIVILAALACDEIEVPVLVDADEILRYMADTDDAQSLYRNSNLILSKPYVYPLDSNAVYIDQVDSTVRDYSVYILDENMTISGDIVQDFGSPYGELRDAEVTVIDRFYLTTSRIEGTDTISFNSVRQMKRYAYFQKLGDDGQAYSGWLMRGFKGGDYDTNSVVINSKVDVAHEDFTKTTADYRNHHHYEYYLINYSEYPPDTIGSSKRQSSHAYLDISTSDYTIMKIDDGEKLTFNMNTPYSRSRLFTISAVSDTGLFQTNLPRDGSPVEIKTPTNNPKTWDLIYIQEFYQNLNDTTSFPPFQNLICRSWCVPYRVK